MRRKTRFVCVSDTHGYTPSEAGFKLPAGDVLIHAGDLTNQGSLSELRKTIDWISKADFEMKIIVCGNHDITLEASFYAEYGSDFHNQRLEDPQRCLEVLTEGAPSILFLRHQSALVRLTRPEGPRTIFKVFGSPYSQSPGNWAFGYASADAPALWNHIPLDADVVVTHTPPRSHCDTRSTGEPVGCPALLQALSQVRPLLAVCGHVHESRGYERVVWPSRPSSGTTGELPDAQVVRGNLPPSGSKKQSLVDLTGKKAERLDNDGFCISGPSSLSTTFGSSQNAMLLPSSPALTCAKPEDMDGHEMTCNDEIRSARRETCIVNASIMATSWPHRGGRKFHAPIVVDLELPTWTEP
ncbi:metallophosphatase domain-containing protein [Aspergillus clavatus NRRL 1]|uniref:Ser/Thr protein phosphatase family protein n=1 Tax=Aspergillus clavatus (strain ATCC 1007 / CBS 513.65 / DSM 816 / NCTC 3887 / NRRL 1 / QM 1276 / 107) TaxID=344612 RepID=A1CR64_ASPCL|nr:Ser/Thr protein phosphatase family protein [Aspergillus clavatus NRRL 1]EAW08135.1 Ser/Thr protein phosphatase family protein [Aspergillus clavatus NRRL 1]